MSELQHLADKRNMDSQFEQNWLGKFLVKHNLAKPADRPVWKQLTGGISSDIWQVELEEKTICVKRALPSLKVKADWHAPTIRNQYEWEYLNFVYSNFPGLVPRPIAHDSELQVLAMEFLPPPGYPVWKTELFSGRIDSGFAAKVGQQLGFIHAKAAGVETLRRTFDTDCIFYSLRIEPYLIATADRHSDLREAITQTAAELGKTHLTLVHGDVSPKNILVGEKGPVFLDAECAWYGDPAFDVAFCLNHFLLKCTILRESAGELINCFSAFITGYFAQINWEAAADFERRCARLLPMLFLARVDGKSPVEYLVAEELKILVRETSRHFILEPSEQLLPIAAHWARVIG
jgi:5-methylthioribose kinase